MIKEQLYEPYTISVETIDEYQRRPRQNTFFELSYVLSGTGNQCINDNRQPYKPGDMFLITPEDVHDFRLDTTTSFFYLRFNDVYLKSNGIVKDNIQRLENLLYNAKQVPGSIIHMESDKQLVKTVVESIMREQINHESCWDKLILALVNALIVIVARNIETGLPEKFEENKEDRALDILQYIQANIYQPELMKADNVSSHFGISLSYLGRYFKKHTGKTMQDYIAAYRIKLVEYRLMHSAMRISEIAEEFGFADESHFNKFFKKQRGVTPSEFRKKQIA